MSNTSGSAHAGLIVTTFVSSTNSNLSKNAKEPTTSFFNFFYLETKNFFVGMWIEDQDLTKTKEPSGNSGRFGNRSLWIPGAMGMKSDRFPTIRESREMKVKRPPIPGTSGPRNEEEDRGGMWTGRLRSRNGIKVTNCIITYSSAIIVINRRLN
jgi:hypothetical protein